MTEQTNRQSAPFDRRSSRTGVRGARTDAQGASAALPPVCILAGGLGTRLGTRVRDIPKPLVEVAGEPFLWHQLRLLAAHGARDVVLCVGYRGELIEQRVGATRFGLRIAYSYDAPELDGTLGAVRRARDLLGERFLVLYGDAYLRIDYLAAARAWRASGLPAMMSVLRNDDRWDVSNALYADGRVLAYDKRAPRPEMRWIDYGLSGLEQKALDLLSPDVTDLARLFARLAEERLLCGVEASERFYEIGTPAALAETDAFLRSAAMPILSAEKSLSPAKKSPAPAEMRSPPPRRSPPGGLGSGTGLFGQGMRFALVGGLVALMYLATTTILSAVVGLPFQLALVVGFCTALVAHFTLQRTFVWAHHENEFALPLHHQVGRYLMVAGTQYGVTAASTALLPAALGLPTEVVYLATFAVTVASNFLVFRHGIFHARGAVLDPVATVGDACEPIAHERSLGGISADS